MDKKSLKIKNNLITSKVGGDFYVCFAAAVLPSRKGV